MYMYIYALLHKTVSAWPSLAARINGVTFVAWPLRLCLPLPSTGFSGSPIQWVNGRAHPAAARVPRATAGGFRLGTKY